tara:strand:+ start:2185 stop:2415 length:231 start_codon:yes stop_codon:yes gene_type:complete
MQWNIVYVTSNGSNVVDFKDPNTLATKTMLPSIHIYVVRNVMVAIVFLLNHGRNAYVLLQEQKIAGKFQLTEETYR